MARINGYVTQRPDAYEYYIEWEEFDVNQQNNTSSVRATAYIKCNSHTSYENNKTTNLWIKCSLDEYSENDINQDNDGMHFSNKQNINLSPRKSCSTSNRNIL